ncbi:helix-turn-helix domain-containing protein [Paenibacillus sp. FSL R7-0048]|jgi:excisionase family DNA binding protein|uniref:helix-turn-helix domain-containing protein n=1 Tax=Paenibacillus TaxID=44249 RepID=UPI00096F89C5|nr:helix-turn-helix domain-containing protein [Paenibacillus odorifer]OMD87771.1 hypothetical protein BSK53_01935 [Paenibacillus odorifer]
MKEEHVASDFLDAVAEKVASKILPTVLKKIEENIPISGDKMVEAEKAAEILGVSKDLIYRLCSQKQIPHVKSGAPGSRRPKMMFSIRSLEEWIRQQERLNCPTWDSRA